MSVIFTVTLVRHGETLSNRQNIMQGQLDTQLSDLGQKQAEMLASHLRNETFTHAFSSDLARASNTAQAIIAANASPLNNLVLDQRLRERGFGYLEGKPLEEMKKAMRESNVSSHQFTPEGGETMEQVTHRAKQFLDDLFRQMAQSLLSAVDQPNNGNEDAHCSGSDARAAIEDDFSPSAQNDAVNSASGQSSDPSQSGHSSKHSLSNITRVPSDIATCSLSREGSSVDLHSRDANILIVSHGLLLRELKRLILDRFKGKLEGRNAQELHRICPNTGLSRFTMSVCYRHNKICVRCLECHVLNDTSHLGGSKEDLVSHAQFQGAL